ncbi:Uncharacterised protein [Vibrio cholerae]|nr:Uncharacterised protein [Vibrio cholerae]CSI76798.1 Uncharacterised protein [Vibrio cholerae]
MFPIHSIIILALPQNKGEQIVNVHNERHVVQTCLVCR